MQPRLEAEILLAHALDVDRIHLYSNPKKPLTQNERLKYRCVVKERRSGKPLQHITGEVNFYGLRFRVDPETLIPRNETEELFNQILKHAPRDRQLRCLDLGTGTGVIAVCMARYHPHAEVVAVDISPAALGVARENAALNGVDARIDFIQSDWLDAVEGRFDLIASNPPYICSGDLADLPVEVRDHEPAIALDGGKDGLDKIRTIADQLRDHLCPDGIVLMEIGHEQGSRVKHIFEDIGLVDVSVERDMAKRDRFVAGRCPS